MRELRFGRIYGLFVVVKTPSERLTETKRRFARAILRAAGALADAPQRTALLTHSLPLILEPSMEWNAERAHALDQAIAASLTTEARHSAREAIARAHATTAIFGSDPNGSALIAYLPSGDTLRGRFVARRFVAEGE